LSVPNSRTRRPTAAAVNRAASANAAASTAIASHLPRLFASEAAPAREPDTESARLAEEVTVAPGIAFWMALCTAAIRVELAAFT
jgi:hypothetical protein